MPNTPKTGRCGHSACVDVKPVGGQQFRFTSTIAGNDGAVTYTRDELVQFFSDVKAGNWDHLL